METEPKTDRHVNSRRWRQGGRNPARWRDRAMKREGGNGPGSRDIEDRGKK